jgi:hypothetical protein
MGTRLQELAACFLFIGILVQSHIDGFSNEQGVEEVPLSLLRLMEEESLYLA